MRRILRAAAVCLRVRDHRESSKLVTLFTRDRGRIVCIAKGARRPRSRFGAALDLFAESRVIYHWHDNRTLYTISDAELARSHSALALEPARFLAAEQIAEFVLRTTRPLDPNPSLYDLLTSSLGVLDTAAAGFTDLACSFLLKAASFSGFRPELRHCLICRRSVAGTPVLFDPARGGAVCDKCGRNTALDTRLEPDSLAVLVHLLYTPTRDLAASPARTAAPLPLVLSFLGHHFDPLVLNSFRARPTRG